MELLYADKRIAVAVKPPGVLSTDEPGGMPELLRAQLGTPCIRTVHRLDAATGGVMVFARSAAAASILSGQVREHRFRKIYLAVVRGDPGQGGIWRDMLGRDPVRRVTYIAREPGKDVRPAELSYETLAVREGLSLQPRRSGLFGRDGLGAAAVGGGTIRSAGARLLRQNAVSACV